MPVGGFPGLAVSRRRTIRAPVNPMDKSTVVSIYPRHIIERKHTIQPGRFEIQAGTIDTPKVLIVGPSSWWKEIDEEQPLLEIPNSSIQVAEAIVRDYCSGILGCDMNGAMPGLFWTPGSFEAEEFLINPKLSKLLGAAQVRQTNWFRALVKMADGLWARTNGNPLVISDDMRLAAEQLNLKGKDWMKDFVMSETVRCNACGSPRNPLFPVCPTCKAVVDIDKAKELNLKFAQ